MGSVEAWQYTQRIAGLIFAGLGGVLTIVMGIICLTFGGKETMLVLERAVSCLIWEVALIFAAYVGIVVHISLRYDKNGDRRKK